MTDTLALKRPDPHLGLYDRDFWAYLSTGAMHLQLCNACWHRWFPPGPVCPRCQLREWSWRPVSGRGVVLSWAVFHRQYFAEMPAPYTVVAGELEEGPIVVADFDAKDEGDLHLHMPMRLGYRAIASEQAGHLTSYYWARNESRMGGGGGAHG